MTKKVTRTKSEGVFGLFKILGDRNRYNALVLLLRSKNGLCVQTIAEKLNMSHSAVSHLLGTLHDNGVVSYSREGREIRYIIATSPVAQKIVRLLQALKTS